MKGEKVTAGGVQFNSRTALSNYAKQLLRDAHDRELTENEQRIIIDMFAMHARFSEKVPEGVEGIHCVRIQKVVDGQWQYCAVMKNGREEVFSYKKSTAIDTETIVLRRVDEALRNAVVPQIEDYRNKYLEHNKILSSCDVFLCQLTGLLFKTNYLHVDHVIPFSDIVSRYTVLRGIKKNDIPVKSIGRDFAEEWIVSDEHIKKDFSQYHKEQAKLQCIPKSLNERLGKIPHDSRRAKEIIERFKEDMLAHVSDIHF